MAGNKRKQWGILVGEPYPAYRDSCNPIHIGKFVDGGSVLFFTKVGAQRAAKAREDYRVWHYTAKKITPKRDK